VSHAIDHDNMRVVGEIYKQAFFHTFGNFNEDIQKEVAIFWTDSMLRRKPYLMVTDGGFIEVREAVFNKSKNITDFMLMFVYTFFVMLAAAPEERTTLIAVTANSLSRNFGGTRDLPDFRGIPVATASRLAEENDVFNMLSANTWLLLMVLAPVFMKYSDFLPEPKAKK
jgi:hypothetical protein